MRYEERDNLRFIIPSEGKFLHKDDVYTSHPVRLGTTDSADNWEEVDEMPEPVPPEESEDVS